MKLGDLRPAAMLTIAHLHSIKDDSLTYHPIIKLSKVYCSELYFSNIYSQYDRSSLITGH